ncbi:Hsp70 protein that interacts with Zuo1p [Tulasnella sp. 419]|nr:Hsp70 protein that interacts with Zuo1p [Tulasnella sp. 419]
MAHYIPSDFDKTVIGINFGNSYASIAVINKARQPECIANEDGERQIAAAISYSGQEVYVGNGAKPHLIKNAQNTITQFRNLLGRKYSSLQLPSEATSAPVIQGPDDTPAYAVSILVPPTPAPSVQPTPISTPRPSSPRPSQQTLTVDEAATNFIKSLHDSALDFLGKPIDGGAVITVPSWFDEPAKQALKRAAEGAGLKVLQLLDEAAAVVIAYQERDAKTQDKLDKITLVLDLGASSLNLALLSVNQGLIHVLGSLTDTTIGGDAIDDLLIAHFAKEFTKKTKIPLQVPNATSPEDKRAEAKLRLAVEHTKRSISAAGGSGTATCSVESLKEGYDFSGTITRLRFDLLVNKVYKQVADKVREVLQKSDVDVTLLDEILLVGATASLGGLAAEIQSAVQDETVTRIRQDLETFEVLAKGAALQARLLASTEDEKVLKAMAGEDDESRALTKVNVTTKPIGLVFPGDPAGGQWVPVVAAGVPLPVRRVVRFNVDPSKTTRVGVEVWEGKDIVKVEKVQQEKIEPEEGEEEEEEEEEEVRTRDVEKETLLGGLDLQLGGNTKKKVPVLIKIQVDVNGALEARLWQEGLQDQAKTLKVN